MQITNIPFAVEIILTIIFLVGSFTYFTDLRFVIKIKVNHALRAAGNQPSFTPVMKANVNMPVQEVSFHDSGSSINGILKRPGVSYINKPGTMFQKKS